jgi:hypothetical protein
LERRKRNSPGEKEKLRPGFSPFYHADKAGKLKKAGAMAAFVGVFAADGLSLRGAGAGGFCPWLTVEEKLALLFAGFGRPAGIAGRIGRNGFLGRTNYTAGADNGELRMGK